MIAPAASLQSQASYDQMAAYYDEFTHNHDYGLWHSTLLPAAERHGLRGRRLLDVGCGTGKSFLPLIEQPEWTITACELSPQMLEIARRKAPGVRMVVADLRSMPRLGEFDLVWALSDVLNYMQSADELTAALRGMAANLAPGGLVLFDVNTLHTYRTFYSETDSEEREGTILTWRGTAAPDMAPGEVATAWFEVSDPASPGAPRFSVPHRQRHFPPEIVLACLDAAGLRCAGLYGQGFDAVLHDDLDERVHTKAVFIANAKEGR